MRLAGTNMPTFANYLVVLYEYATHHWVRVCAKHALFGKLQRSLHEFTFFRGELRHLRLLILAEQLWQERHLFTARGSF